MLVSLSPQTDKKGERMNSVMCHRQGGGLQEMISRTDFTGTGTFNLNAENVSLIENIDYSAMKVSENQKITLNDVSTGITEADGKVTLRYVVTLE